MPLPTETLALPSNQNPPRNSLAPLLNPKPQSKDLVTTCTQMPWMKALDPHLPFLAKKRKQGCQPGKLEAHAQKPWLLPYKKGETGVCCDAGATRPVQEALVERPAQQAKAVRTVQQALAPRPDCQEQEALPQAARPVSQEGASTLSRGRRQQAQPQALRSVAARRARAKSGPPRSGSSTQASGHGRHGATR